MAATCRIFSHIRNRRFFRAFRCDCRQIVHNSLQINNRSFHNLNDFNSRALRPESLSSFSCMRLLFSSKVNYFPWKTQKCDLQTSCGTSDQTDPYYLVNDNLSNLHINIKLELRAVHKELREIACYHFDGQGKSFRPMVILLMAACCNLHNKSTTVLDSSVLDSQKQIAMIAEMIHTASLMHDDVVDTADTRRGKPSVQKEWGQKKAIFAGNFILSVSSIMLARIGNNDVVKVLSRVLEDLIKGEFMQLGSKESESERYNHYMKKTFKKTASLIANSCKTVAMLGGCSDDVIEVAYQYGRNIGIAFQLVDDLLDFISTECMMGKPAAIDLQLGLATAPVLFAANEHPELNAMIMRRFTEDGDVDRAWQFVKESDGIEQTRYLAEQHSKEALRQINQLNHCSQRDALESVTSLVLNRLK